MLAHYIEEEGVPTACISAIRQDSEIVKPPRSLWTSFELGRPLGIPNDAAFQKRVLCALLRLFEEKEGPVIMEDFPEDAPELNEDITVLSCPVNYNRGKNEPRDTNNLKTVFLLEINSMLPWYQIAVKRRKRTTIGLSGIDIDGLGEFLYAFTESTVPENPRKDVDISTALKAAVEDLRAYYFEAITAQPGTENISNKALLAWFWEETVAGKVLLEIWKVCELSTDKAMQYVAKMFIVPPEVIAKYKQK